MFLVHRLGKSLDLGQSPGEIAGGGIDGDRRRLVALVADVRTVMRPKVTRRLSAAATGWAKCAAAIMLRAKSVLIFMKYYPDFVWPVTTGNEADGVDSWSPLVVASRDRLRWIGAMPSLSAEDDRRVTAVVASMGCIRIRSLVRGDRRGRQPASAG